MSVNSKDFKENGNQFYPVTHIEAVIDGNGTTLDSLLSGKQETLVSGTNIKTINNNSLLGNGNITISGGGSAGTLNTTATTAQSTNASESLSGSVTLHKVAKTGTYSDLIGKPTIPSAPGTLNTTATTAQSTSSSEALSGSITLHKVAKTGTYSDLVGKPTIPSAPGSLVTNATTAQTASSGEAMSGSITLHKVAKTGTYSDLISRPDLSGYKNIVYLSSESSIPASPDADTLYVILDDGTSANYQLKSNLVTSISSSSTNTQYPSAKCVYDLLGDVETLINAL